MLETKSVDVIVFFSHLLHSCCYTCKVVFHGKEPENL